MIPFDLTLSLLKKSSDPISDILRTSAYWIPLQMLYVELVKNKDIIQISDLYPEQKEKYWSLVKDLDKDKWAKISIAQALYTYETYKL